MWNGCRSGRNTFPGSPYPCAESTCARSPLSAARAGARARAAVGGPGRAPRLAALVPASALVLRAPVHGGAPEAGPVQVLRVELARREQRAQRARARGLARAGGAVAGAALLLRAGAIRVRAHGRQAHGGRDAPRLAVREVGERVERVAQLRRRAVSAAQRGARAAVAGLTGSHSALDAPCETGVRTRGAGGSLLTVVRVSHAFRAQWPPPRHCADPSAVPPRVCAPAGHLARRSAMVLGENLARCRPACARLPTAACPTPHRPAAQRRCPARREVVPAFPRRHRKIRPTTVPS